MRPHRYELAACTALFETRRCARQAYLYLAQGDGERARVSLGLALGVFPPNADDDAPRRPKGKSR